MGTKEYFEQLDAHLNKRMEWDNRMIGMQTMHNTVLRWLLDHRRDVPALHRDSLMRIMQGAIDSAMLEQPPLLPPNLEGTAGSAT